MYDICISKFIKEGYTDMLSFKKTYKTGNIKNINGIDYMYINHKWIPLITHIDTINKTEELKIIQDNFKRYIVSEDIFIENNPVLSRLPKSSKFTHLLYLINYTQLADISILDTYTQNIIDDTHSSSYTRFLEIIVTIEAECDSRFLNMLFIKYLKSMETLRPEYTLEEWEYAFQVFPWIYLLPHYNKVYTDLYVHNEPSSHTE